MSYFTFAMLWLFCGLLGWMWFNHMITSSLAEAGQKGLPGKPLGFVFLVASGFFALVIAAIHALSGTHQRHRWGLRLW